MPLPASTVMVGPGRVPLRLDSHGWPAPLPALAAIAAPGHMPSTTRERLCSFHRYALDLALA
jgi:hypothetical protein